MKFEYIFLIFIISIFPPTLHADVFNGDISFANCEESCNSAGEHEIKFYNKINFTLRIVIDEDSYFPVMKTVNTTKEIVGWSYHIVFFDKNNNIIAAYSLSGETGNTNEYGNSTSSSRIYISHDDMNKITKYQLVSYTS